MRNFKITVFAFAIGLISCSTNESSSNLSNGEALVKKRIIQKIETAGMGMLENLEIETIDKINDSTYKGVHSFTNPMVGKEIRVTREYSFTADLDSITKAKKLKTEMKSAGEWVDAGF